MSVTSSIVVMEASNRELQAYALCDLCVCHRLLPKESCLTHIGPNMPSLTACICCHQAGRALLRRSELEIFECPLHLEGGSIHTDGEGCAALRFVFFITSLCLLCASRLTLRCPLTPEPAHLRAQPTCCACLPTVCLPYIS